MVWLKFPTYSLWGTHSSYRREAVDVSIYYCKEQTQEESKFGHLLTSNES